MLAPQNEYLRGEMLTRPYICCFIVTLVFFLTGCGLYFRNWPVGDGNTWQVNASNVSADCNGYSSAASCIGVLQPKVELHATEICGKKPYRIFLCEKLGNAVNGLAGIGCKVQCNEGTQVQIVGDKSQADTSPPTADVVSKARKCQAKGGVWLNNSCQVTVD